MVKWRKDQLNWRNYGDRISKSAQKLTTWGKIGEIAPPN
jgi:hypothetical protein